MPLFLGYDPGGQGKHGVAAVNILEDGAFDGTPTMSLMRTASEVCEWMANQPSPEAIGIDTLLAWSSRGRRQCDEWLRCRYPAYKNTVVHQNSLYSAMTINGAIVANIAAGLGVALVESHPKLLRKAILRNDAAEELLSYCRTAKDHEADALIASWSAAMFHFGHWCRDLYKSGASEYTFPAGRAVYPWPKGC